MKITESKTFQGAIELSTVKGGQRIHKQYMGFTKKEARTMFKDHVNNVQK